MPAKRRDTRNIVKKLCLYALLCAVCMVVGYIESLLDLFFIAPGIKLGLANSVACSLIVIGDIKGSFAVNISRIVLTSLLFGSPVSLAFALAGGIISLTVMSLLNKTGFFSVTGISIAGGTVHNIVQCAVGALFVGVGTLYYLPVLLLAGAVCGGAVGLITRLILKRFKGSINNV